MSAYLAAILTISLPASVGQLSNADRAKVLERIGSLEADLARITNELEVLRSQLADKTPLPKQVKWLQALDETYEKLLGETLDKELLIAADKAFGRNEPRVALRLLRTGRHRAAVPLIVRDMVRRQSQAKLAKDELKDHLAKTLNDRPKTDRIHDTLWSFQHATGQSWISAGHYPFEHYEKTAAKALAWWKTNRTK